ICSDKTGTLTQNKMTVTKLYTYGELKDIADINIMDRDVELALKIGLLCNDAIIEEYNGEKKPLGDPTEVALVVAAQQHRLFKKEQEAILERVKEIPFDSDRKLMTTIHKTDKGYKILTKGALDILMDKCTGILINGNVQRLTTDMKKTINKVNENLSQQALRVIALAYKDTSKDHNSLKNDYAEQDLIFVGMFGMIDPPRQEARIAVAKCKEAGIKPVMITGDHKVTAMAIAKELGILN
ncbi:ATPase, P-type (transporting), HAD superfamily, subfamily IC, partial [Gottschalkia purinilytica]